MVTQNSKCQQMIANTNCHLISRVKCAYFQLLIVFLSDFQTIREASFSSASLSSCDSGGILNPITYFREKLMIFSNLHNRHTRGFFQFGNISNIKSVIFSYIFSSSYQHRYLIKLNDLCRSVIYLLTLHRQSEVVR